MTNEEAACLLDPETNYSALVQYEAGSERMDAVEEALRIAAAVLRGPPMTSMTLEQLRGMGGQPVWIVEYPDWGHWELSENGEDYIADRDPDLYGLRHDDPECKYGLHKLGWIAYAYPPPNPTPVDNPLTLEQLREMVDKPAYLYIYDTALDSGWHIIKAVTDDKIIFRGWNTVYVPISSLGKCFDLYAYFPAHISPCQACGYGGKHLDAPPCITCPAHPKIHAHIDQEAWGPCELCEKPRKVFSGGGRPC